jgi:hypothetical protein
MSQATRKTEIEPLDGSPEKRLYWSIISDYDNKTAITELVDNAIDIFMIGDQQSALLVDVTLDVDQRPITIVDNASGVTRGDLRYLIAPGASKNDAEGDTIGIFGVGSKRAVVALGEYVTIKTCHKKGQSFQLDITKDWMESMDWTLPAYLIPDIAKGTTQIECVKLRKPITSADVTLLHEHFGETYGWFLKNGKCTIRINGEPVKPILFNSWAYPPDYPPKKAKFEISPDRVGELRVEIHAGLIRDRKPSADNYGVYFYCNNRLIAKEVRSRDVGYYVTAEAGVPHPDASLCRAIVRFNGPAKLMPWNSNKTAIMFEHQAFTQVRPTLLQLVSHFSKLSRALKTDWENTVFCHDKGTVESVDAERALDGGRLVLPPLPRVNKRYSERLKEANDDIIRDQPWTLGLVEAISAVDVISRQRFETKNRLALIMLDSNFEIALKEFVVHRDDLFPNPDLKYLFDKRANVIKAVYAKVKIDQTLIKKAEHYYALRNKFIHERATVDVTNENARRVDASVTQIRETRNVTK